jgi:hypothetical protein
MNPQMNVSDMRARWTVFVHNKQLGFAWVVAVLLGALLITASQQLDVKRFFAPVVIMIVYSLVVFNRGQDLFRSAEGSNSYQDALVSQLADSVYFMGFLWTLWALIDSFVLKTDPAATSIFRTFGYALVTTSCGMFMRLAILQFRYTAIDQSVGAEVSVEERLQRFGLTMQAAEAVLTHWNAVLSDSAKSTSALNKELEKTLAGISEEVRGSMQLIMTEHKAMISATVTQSCSGIEDIVRAAKAEIVELTSHIAKPLQTEVGAMTEVLKRANTSLSKSLPKFSERVDVWADDMKRTDEAFSLVRTSSAAADVALVGLTASVQGAASECAKVKDVRELLKKILEEGSDELRAAATQAIRDGLKHANWAGAVVIAFEDQKIVDTIQQATAELKESNGTLHAELIQLLEEVRKISSKPHAAGGDGGVVVKQEVVPVIREIRDKMVEVKETLDRRPKLWPW